MTTPDYYERLTQEFKKSKEAIDALTKRQNEMRAELVNAIMANGYEDDKGHHWYKVGDYELKYERRISRSFNSEAAKKWAEETGNWESVKEVVEVLNEDKLLGLAWENPSLADTIQSFYTERETWAFKA